MSTSINVPSPDRQATAAMLDHHAALRRGLDERVHARRMAVRTQARYKNPLAALTAFLTDSVLPHATAEEATLYPAAAADAGASLLVEAMVAEHRALTDRTRTLANARSSVDALAVAEGIAAAFDRGEPETTAKSVSTHAAITVVVTVAGNRVGGRSFPRATPADRSRSRPPAPSSG